MNVATGEAECAHREAECAHREASPGGGLHRYQNLVSESGLLTVVVLHEPNTTDPLLCDGQPMREADPSPCGASPAVQARQDVAPGDRLIDPDSGLVVICPRGGSGALSFVGRPLWRDPCTRWM